MERYRLLIIGAGASGIAAASRLLEKGFNDFRILEAENRIGGRVNTIEFENEFIELGAEWIHGETDNAVFELASKCNFADNSESEIQFSNTNFFDYSGQRIPRDISDPLVSAYEEVFGNIGSLDESKLEGSAGAYFNTELKKKVDEIRKTKTVEESLFKKFVNSFENFTNSIDGSHSWYDTSIRENFEYWECLGNILTRWNNRRYDTIFKLLTKKIPEPKNQLPIDDKILLNKRVVRVNWKKESVLDVPDVEVECSDRSIFHADHVLITCSLGVLKEKAAALFLPSLPQHKSKCIENLGFGTVDKIFITFENHWWGDDVSGFGFLWSEEEIKNDLSGWLSGVICFHPVTPSSKIWRGWITAETAWHMESLPHHEILQGLNYLIEKFLSPSLNVSKITNCITSKWYSNPHFRGSYSCRVMKSETANVWASDLAEPVYNDKGKPILLFGGEATSTHYFSTVHGAIESGRREAARLLPLLL